MNKKFRLLSLISALAISSLSGLTACGGDGVGEHDHVYDEGTVTTEATCYKEGVKTFTCTVEGCGQTKTAPIAMIAHSWNGGEVTKQAKCDEEGVKIFTCTVEGCGKTKEEPIEKIEHSWNGGVITKTPDFLTNGTKTLTCLDCEEEKTESVAACADFTAQYYSTLTESNNWHYGYANTYDTQTGEVGFTTITETENNVWKAGTTEIGKGYVCTGNIAVIAYTFNQELPKVTQTDIAVSFVGEDSATCLKAFIIVGNYCVGLNSDNAKDWSYRTEEALDIKKDDTVYLVLENNGEGKAGGNLAFGITAPCIHVWDDGTVTKEATCSADGVKEYGCVSCDKTYTEAITERSGHSYTGDWLVGTNGHYKKCEVCETASDEEAHNHITEDTSKRVEAKCNADGVKYLVCECGDEVTEAITERPAHDWRQTAHQDATNDVDGYTDYECGNAGCGATKRDTIPSLAHNKGTEYGTDDNNHWFVCSEHTDCGVKFEEAPHNYTEKRTNATLYTAGKVEFICSCGKHDTAREEVLPARASFRDDFEVNENGTFSGWSVGIVNYDFPTETFDFTKITAANAGGDAYNNANPWVEIKGDWMASNGMTGFAYLFGEEATVSVTFNLHCLATDGKYSLRWAIKDKDGNIKNPEGKAQFVANDKDIQFLQEISVEKDYVLYLLINKEGGGDQSNFDITLTVSGECAHSWNNGEVTTEAACNADGVKTYTCTKCHETKTEPITERPAHDWRQTAHQDATNDDDGYTDYECGNAGCGATKRDTIPALNHKKGTVYGTDDDKHWFTCTEHAGCGYKFEEAAHNYTEHLESQDKAATCNEDGYTVWKCVCGKTENRTVSKDTVPHNYEGQPLVKENETTHSQNCKVCGYVNSVEHSWNDGEITTPATFWTEGVKTKTCACNATKTETVAKIDEIDHADEFTVANQDGNWEYGKIDMNDWDHMAGNTKTQSTATNEGNDGWVTGDYSSIKRDWMSASNAIYIAFKATEAVTVKVEIVVTRIDGMKRLDVRTDSDDENNAKYHGNYGEDGKMTVTETYTLSEGNKLYMVFTAKGEDSGFEQANYSIKITRV